MGTTRDHELNFVEIFSSQIKTSEDIALFGDELQNHCISSGKGCHTKAEGGHVLLMLAPMIPRVKRNYSNYKLEKTTGLCKNKLFFCLCACFLTLYKPQFKNQDLQQHVLVMCGTSTVSLLPKCKSCFDFHKHLPQDSSNSRIGIQV